MFLASTIKQNRILLAIVPAVIVIAAISVILLIPKEVLHTFKTEETSFTVKVPSGWKAVELPRKTGGDGVEPSPDEGIKLLLDGNDSNYIWIYSQYGSLSKPEGDYAAEEFTTNKGVKGTLYKDNNSQTNWQLLLNQDIAPDSYGAVVSFEDKELLNKNRELIVDILKSIDIKKP